VGNVTGSARFRLLICISRDAFSSNTTACYPTKAKRSRDDAGIFIDVESFDSQRSIRNFDARLCRPELRIVLHVHRVKFNAINILLEN